MSLRFKAATTEGGQILQPFRAKCSKCGQPIYFDIDPGGTPGFNGDWGDGEGDYGCIVEDADHGNSHHPMNIVYDKEMYPYPH